LVSIEKIINYDPKLFPAALLMFLSLWIRHAEAAYEILSNDRLCGYGVLPRCDRGFNEQ
jgi:hypothetical protein